MRAELALLVVAAAAALVMGVPVADHINGDTNVPALQFPMEETFGDDFPTFSPGDSVMDFFTASLLKIRSLAESALEGHKQDPLVLSMDHATETPVLPDRYFRFIPTYIGAAIANAKSADIPTWSTPCFKKNSARISASDDKGLTLVLSFEEPTSKLCSDEYLLLTTQGIHAHKAFRQGEHKLHWKFHKRTTDDDRAWIAANGIRLFHFEDGVLGSLEDLLATLELFSPVLIPSPSVSKAAAKANLKFIKDYANVTMEERKINYVDVDEDYIKDGDFLGVIRLDGLDTMQCFGTGAHTGHTTVALRIDGELFIVESTDKTAYWPKPNIQRTPFKEWIELARKADYNVRHLPLNAAARAKFNSTAAVEFFKSVEGMPYGYHNFIWGWVDTESGNLPSPLSHQLVEPLFSIIGKYIPAIADKMWNLAFNKRLGTDQLDTIQIYRELQRRNMTFGQLVSMPEQDSWVYPDGPSMVCDVLVCRVYKAGGLFGELADQIQCTEFQNWDVETLDFFDRNPVRPQQCIDADPDLPTCQLMGDYRMHLPDFGTVKPYPHMREKCSALPPSFVRPDGC